MRRRWTAVGALSRAVPTGLVGLAVLLGPAGCSASPADPTPTAIVAPTANCLAPAVLHDLGLTGASTTRGGADITASPLAGKVPDDFVAVSVLVCTPDGSLVDSAGTWLALTASHREGDLAPLIAALRRPSSPREGTCRSAQVAEPALWLVDALGRALRPAWPTDRCGVPRADVAAALAGLEETDSAKFPVQTVPGQPVPTP